MKVERISMQRNYIVYAPAYNENVGGIIFLHELVHVLNQMGERAFLWPMLPSYGTNFRGRLKKFKRTLLDRQHARYTVSPNLNTPIATSGDLGGASIVVYPEIVLGNPLKARNVVRWLLYKPGLRHPYEFGSDNMFFRAGEMSDLPEITGGAPDLFLWKINRTYHNENRPDRDGVCYIVRKGVDKPRIQETEAPGAIQIDKMSHAEINEIFNRCHTFYSYDEATMYSQYAAICGCTSVVIPGLYGSREEWVKNHELARYGVAYGLDDIPHAVTTRDKVLGLLEVEEAKGQATAERFVELTKARFWRDAAA
ncbi:hypothetical protein [Sedimentitalea nanhaiensis]|uniref:Glycosyltransferase family 10 (Fucosyltransferase) C-term n=1 Tax=Sedimentitalea nanhaiensis TaxID=999627 RepID=A0A1I7DL59_9RHOB|nr:hypothetical protein [Sedimentitalea nanhaiensis]SFU12400.1 hypothetical protein SAMN05216236_1307 [Sedimentitalea nanhaiensis]